MKEFEFDYEIKKYKIGEYVFNDDFSWDEINQMFKFMRALREGEEPKTSIVDFLQAHKEKGPQITGKTSFKKIKFIFDILSKGFLVPVEK